MITKIGELTPEKDSPLLKMWRVEVASGVRPFLRHSHTRFEITVVDRGSGEYTTENAVYPMRPGDVFVFSSGEVHCITEAEGGLTITNLHFEPRYLAEHSAGAFLDFCFSHAPDFQSRIPADKAASLRQSHLCIQQEFEVQDADFRTAIRSYLSLMLIELTRRHGYRSYKLDRKQSSLSGILNVYKYVDEHLDETLTLDTLASVAGLTPNYLSHIFKKLNGISLWDFVTARRIEKAVRLIRSSDMTMLEIALECGFHNTVNFNKAFKKQKGITPSALKKNDALLSY